MFDAVARIEVFLRSRLAYFAAKESGAFGYPEGEVLDFVGKVPGLVAEPGDLGTACGAPALDEHEAVSHAQRVAACKRRRAAVGAEDAAPTTAAVCFQACASTHGRPRCRSCPDRGGTRLPASPWQRTSRSSPHRRRRRASAAPSPRFCRPWRFPSVGVLPSCRSS